MKVFMQHEEHPDHAWGVNASVSEVDPKFRAEVQGEDLGTFDTLDEARAVISDRMRDRYGIAS